MPRTHRKRGVGPDVGDDQRLALGGDAAGDALAERHARPADLEAVEAVRRGQRQVRSVAVEQVERGDVGVQHVPGPVDDRLEQLVPRPRRRRQAGDLVQEAQLFELVVGVRGRHARALPARRRGQAWTRSRCWSRASRYKPRERLRPGRLRSGAGLGRGTVPRDGSRDGAAAAAASRRRSPPSRAGSGRPAPATRSRSRSGCSARCSARSSPSRPGPSCSRSSSGSGGGRSPSAATTTRSSASASTRSCGGLDLGARRGRHQRVRALLRAGQPGRGARPRPDAAPARARGARRRPRRLGRRRGRRAAPPRADGRRAGRARRPARRSRRS